MDSFFSQFFVSSRNTLPLLCLVFIHFIFNLKDAYPAQKSSRPNILFIAIDDLRPELGCYGNKGIHSPNLDRLATQGRCFLRAYCQEAICSPSRASLLTGSRPDTIGVIENRAYFRDLNPHIVTLPQHFIAHGYSAVYSGKIFHGGMTDEQHSWNHKPNRKGLTRPTTVGGNALPENQRIYAENKDRMVALYGESSSRGLIHGPAFEAAQVEDDGYVDGYNTSVAIQTLDELVQQDKPWFLALGFVRPHLPFHAPKKYFDLYDPEEIQLTTSPEPPQNGASMGLHASFELRTRHGIPKSGPINESLSRELLHAYYACVSYVDAQIGRLITAIEKNQVRDNTIIVVWGDHGWHLGEYGIWGKATNYEIATRVPLIICTPSMPQKGSPSDSLVELIDIYPTLCDLANIPQPDHLAGESLIPVLHNPNAIIKGVAMSQFPTPALREWAANPLSPEMRETFFGPLISQVEQKIRKQQGSQWNRELFEKHLMGYTIRDPRYRYIEWRDTRNSNAGPIYQELYDHLNDPHETVNVAHSQQKEVVRLSRELQHLLGN
ncbi:MAG: sulfatase [Pirellulales bacterium]|jgi:iduronate 2-sulfatase